MPAVSKFMFDTAFDADVTGAKPAGSTSSGKVLMTKDEFEAAKAKAFAEGQQAGEAKAAAEVTALAAQATKVLAAQSATLVAQAENHHQERMRDAVEVAVSAVQRLLPGLLQREGTGEIEALFRSCITRLHDEPRIVVRINDSLLDHMRDRLENLAAAGGFGGRLVLLADASLALGDARIEWADGGVERSPDAVQAEIAAVIDRYLNKTDDHPGRH
jgi:flagellar assembly protein FliH